MTSAPVAVQRSLAVSAAGSISHGFTVVDLVRLVCTQCGEQEVCPDMLMENYEAMHEEPATASDADLGSPSATKSAE